MIRVVVTGSECTGKTTLAGDLAAAYGVEAVPEYARRFVLEKGAAPGPADVEAIARGQIALEDRALAQGAPAEGALAAVPRLLVQDTDLLSTIVYARHYHGGCPAWVERALGERAGDLYLLAGLDVPWEPDGHQRDRSHRREEMQDLFRAALTARDLPFVEIGGDRAERLAAAHPPIDQLLARPRTTGG